MTSFKRLNYVGNILLIMFVLLFVIKIELYLIYTNAL